MVTLKDVAMKAGVSTATASYCLTGAKEVKPETRMRVMQAIEELNYVPNAAARDLRRTSTRKIGIVLPDLNDYFFSEILNGVSRRLQEADYLLNIAFSYQNPRTECERIDAFINENVAGMLILTCQPENSQFFENRLSRYHIPKVFLHNSPQSLHVNLVEIDNYRTAKTITCGLLEKGYTDIAVIMGDRRFSSEDAFFRGVQDAYSDAGKIFRPERRYVTNMSKENAFQAAMLACSEGYPHAVLCTSSLMVKGVYEALDIQKIRIPSDTVVVTLGEECWNRSNHLPGVFYSRRAASQMGRGAADLLMRGIACREDTKKQTVSYPDHIIFRTLHIDSYREKAFLEISANESQTLKILTTDIPSVRALKMLSPCFTLQTGIRVQYETIDIQDLLNVILEDSKRKKPTYDIMMFDAPWTSQIYEKRAFQDLNPLMESDDFDQSRILANCWEIAKCGEHLLGLPFVAGSQILFYRKDLFERPAIIREYRDFCGATLRPPKTWQEFNQIASFFTRSLNPKSLTAYGTILPIGQNESLIPEILLRIWASGGKLWEKSGKPMLWSSQNERAFQLVFNAARCVGENASNMDSQAVMNAFCHGDVAMIIAFNEYAGQIRASLNRTIIGDIGYCALPYGTAMYAGWSLGIHPNTEKVPLAYQFFRWLCQTDTSYYYTILGGQSTVVTPYENNEIINLYPWMALTQNDSGKYYFRSGPSSRLGRGLVPANEVERIACDALRRTIYGKETIREALEWGQEQMEKLYRANQRAREK